MKEITIDILISKTMVLMPFAFISHVIYVEIPPNSSYFAALIEPLHEKYTDVVLLIKSLHINILAMQHYFMN